MTIQTIDFADQLLKLVAAVPASVWGGLLGAGVTLAGVLVTNWGMSKRLAQQLSHDAEQKKLDRLASLRKDVYLKAGEQLVRAQQHLSGLNASTSLDTNPADGITDFLALSAQVALIATDRTARLVNELSLAIGEAFMELLPAAVPAHREHVNIKIANDEISGAQRLLEEILLAMRQLADSGSPDPARFGALQASLGSERTKLDELILERDEAYQRLFTANKEFSALATALSERLSGPILEAQFALREEIGLSSDRAAALEQLARSRERMALSGAAANERIMKSFAAE